jgi:hypothetical protein
MTVSYAEAGYVFWMVSLKPFAIDAAAGCIV